MSSIIFDMDGVLVDVTGSYRQAIMATVERFTGRRPTQEDIQLRKNAGGFNDDWELSRALCREFGVEAPFQEVVDVFQRLYEGAHDDGLKMNERWLPRDGLLERLARRHRLALFTGRFREETDFTLRRFAPSLRFDPTVCMHDVEQKKPHPEGLLKIRAAVGDDDLVYVGDNVDDCDAARAAGIRFVGVAAPGLPQREALIAHFHAAGAVAIIPDVNALEEVL